MLEIIKQYQENKCNKNTKVNNKQIKPKRMVRIKVIPKEISFIPNNNVDILSKGDEDIEDNSSKDYSNKSDMNVLKEVFYGIFSQL